MPIQLYVGIVGLSYTSRKDDTWTPPGFLRGDSWTGRDREILDSVLHIVAGQEIERGIQHDVLFHLLRSRAQGLHALPVRPRRAEEIQQPRMVGSGTAGVLRRFLCYFRFGAI